MGTTKGVPDKRVPKHARASMEMLTRAPVSSLYEIVQADAFSWLAGAKSCSIHAVVTDPPYGLVEYSPKQLAKMKNGQGGVWRIPPSFDGRPRRPPPRPPETLAWPAGFRGRFRPHTAPQPTPGRD